MVNPLVTVCIPTLARPELVTRALPSVLDAHSSPVEVIVAADAGVSLPASPLLADARVTVIAASGGGPSIKRNAAAQQARGEVLLFLDDDDELAPNALDGLLMVMRAGAGFASGSVEFRRPDQAPELLPLEDLGPLFDGMVGCFMAGSFVVRTELFHAVGGYEERLGFGENAELCMRIAQAMTASGSPWGTISAPAVRVYPSSSRYIDARAMSAEIVLEVHRDVFARDQVLRARWQAMAGVAQMRAGDSDKARAHLRAAMAAQPLRPQHWFRLALAHVPPLARRRWASK